MVIPKADLSMTFVFYWFFPFQPQVLDVSTLGTTLVNLGLGITLVSLRCYFCEPWVLP